MTDELANHVCDQVADGRVRRMFGGWAVYSSEAMVAIVYDGRVYLKASTQQAQSRHIAAGMSPFRPRPQQEFRSFWELPPDVIDDVQTLRSWLDSSG